MAEPTEKAVKKAIKRRFDYMKAHRNELTLRQTRRLLESDLQLPQNALDKEPHKSLIKHQVDEIMRLLVVLETEPDGGAAAPHATKAANQKRAREEPRPDEPPKLGSSARALALKAVLKRATMPVAPALYKAAAGDEALFCAALERALAHEGLHHGSTDKEIAAVRQKRERARDLDGIDATNLIDADVRPRRAAAAAAAAVAPDAAHKTAYGGAGAAADAASSPPGRRRKLRVEEWEDDDA